jgi:hypothetical protein
MHSQLKVVKKWLLASPCLFLCTHVTAQEQLIKFCREVHMVSQSGKALLMTVMGTSHEDLYAFLHAEVAGSLQATSIIMVTMVIFVTWGIPT